MLYFFFMHIFHSDVIDNEHTVPLFDTTSNCHKVYYAIQTELKWKSHQIPMISNPSIVPQKLCVCLSRANGLCLAKRIHRIFELHSAQSAQLLHYFIIHNYNIRTRGFPSFCPLDMRSFISVMHSWIQFHSSSDRNFPFRWIGCFWQEF